MVTVAITGEDPLYLQKGVPSIELVIFDSIYKMQEHIDANPMILGDLVLIENYFQFSNSNIKVLMEIIESPFFSMLEDYIYYYVEQSNFKRIQTFVKGDDRLKDKIIVVPVDGSFSREIVLRILKYEFRKSLNEKEKKYTIRRISKKEHFELKNLDSTHEMANASLAQSLPVAEEEIMTVGEAFDNRRLRSSNADSIINKKYIFLQDEGNMKINAILMATTARRLTESGRILLFENDREMYLEHLLRANKIGHLAFDVSSFGDIYEMKKKIMASKEKIILISDKGQSKYYNLDTLLLLVDTFIADLISHTIISRDLKSIEMTVHKYIYAISSDCSNVMRIMRNYVNKLVENINFLLVDDSMVCIPVFKRDTFLELLNLQGIAVAKDNISSIALTNEEGIGDAILRIITR